MAKQVLLPHGVLYMGDKELVMEIPIKQARIQTPEQLSELKKEDPLFFTCTKQAVTEETAALHYAVEEGYKPLREHAASTMQVKQEIAKDLLLIRKIQGTQFTTYIHPENIYANKEGRVKFIHRGIRSVLPPDQEEGKVFVFQIKCLILSIFSGVSYFELLNNGAAQFKFKDKDLVQLQKAKSLKEIEVLLSKDLSGIKQPAPESKIPQAKTAAGMEQKHEKPPMKPSVSQAPPAVQQRPAAPYPAEVRPAGEKPKTMNPALMFVSAAGFLIFGILAGVLGSYLFQVKPNSTALASNVEEKNAIEERLQGELVKKERTLEAYKLAAQKKNDEAVKAFESMDSLSKEDETVLANLYMESDNPEHLVKAASMNPNLELDAVNQLLDLKTQEANESVLAIPSDNQAVLFEQAVVRKDYPQAAELAKSEYPDDKRANTIVAKGLLEEGMAKEALEFAEKAKDTPLQISILEKQLKDVKADKKMSKKEKEKKQKELSKKIDNLKKNKNKK